MPTPVEQAPITKPKINPVFKEDDDAAAGDMYDMGGEGGKVSSRTYLDCMTPDFFYQIAAKEAAVASLDPEFIESLALDNAPDTAWNTARNSDDG